MPGANVNWPVPLQRLNPWYPGQFGVPGTDNTTGLRLNCTGKILYVDPNFPGTSDQRDGTDPTSPLTTIQAAVGKCVDYAGDVIVVMQNGAWIYASGASATTGITEEVTLNKAGVRLVGVSPSGMGVPWSPASDRGTCLTVTAIDCCVEGFLFTEGAYSGCNGIYAEWDGTTCWGENLVVRNCVFDDSVDTAIQLEYAWYCDIHHNLFQFCDQYGVYADPGGSGIAYCVIHENLFYGIATGAVTIPGADYCKVAWNQFYNATAMGAGAAADVYVTTAGGNENMIDHNDFACDPGPGNGDYNDTNSPSGAVPELDAWIENYLPGGPTTGAPT
jgi:hypothetical protein